MNATITPRPLSGSIKIIASKSQAHRLLILAALAEEKSLLICEGMNEDIAATMDCLNAMGARVVKNGDEISIFPIEKMGGKCKMCVRESGSTLRFLLPVICALGMNAQIEMCGRLPERPISELSDELQRHGVNIVKEGNILHVSGKLESYDFKIAGNISSQYISGLLFAMCALKKPCSLAITGEIQSRSYIEMTLRAMERFGISTARTESGFSLTGDERMSAYCGPVEGDWSNAAFWLCAGAMSEKGITLTGLDEHSAQGDRAVIEILRRFGADVSTNERGVRVRKKELTGTQIDAADIPDLIPVLSVLACAAKGDTRIFNAQRLRIKESDRLAAIYELIGAAGADFTPTPDGLIIHGGAPLHGAKVSAHNDHRMAMSAAVLGTFAGKIEVEGAQCVKKSYPDFWDKFAMLGGNVKRSGV